jgi:hypothetical protein
MKTTRRVLAASVVISSPWGLNKKIKFAYSIDPL